MNITKKFDRAFQWAGEKMGGEAKTTMTEDFKMLETEMALRFEGKPSPRDATSRTCRLTAPRHGAAPAIHEPVRQVDGPAPRPGRGQGEGPPRWLPRPHHGRPRRGVSARL